MKFKAIHRTKLSNGRSRQKTIYIDSPYSKTKVEKEIFKPFDNGETKVFKKDSNYYVIDKVTKTSVKYVPIDKNRKTKRYNKLPKK